MLVALTATLSLVLAIFACATALLAGAYAGGAHKRLDAHDATSLATFRRHLATIERERAERQREKLEADMARAVDPFAFPPASAEGKE